MKYISLIHALNLPCKLETCGDWHMTGIQWDNLHFLESDNSLWGDYGIETNRKIFGHSENYNVANHIRALLDLLYIGNFSSAQGMNKDFICNSKYDEEIFEMVYMMHKLPNWKDIDRFMQKEYFYKWDKFKEGVC